MLTTAILALALACWQAWAVADGHDFFLVVCAASHGVLNIRSEPDASSTNIFVICPHGPGFRNLR
jgi:hypothetical protein